MLSTTVGVRRIDGNSIPLSAKVFVVSCVMALTVFQRVAFTPFKIPMLTIVLFAGMSLLIYDRRVKIDVTKCVLYFICMTALILSTLLGRLLGKESNASDLISLFWLIIIYFPFVLAWNGDPTKVFGFFVSTFLGVMSILAVVGILQYTFQFVGIDLANLTWSFFPESFLLPGFNYDIPIRWGHYLQKANGVFFLEPSFFCKAMGTAVLIELLFRGSVLRLMLYHIALVLSFSGTGFILLAAGYLFLIGRLNARTIVFLSGVLVTAILFATITGYSDIFIERIGEFGSTQSSAHYRFIAPFKGIVELELYNNLISSYGPGSGDEAAERYYSHLGYYLKFLYEYGLIPAILFTFFIIVCATRYGAPASVVFALLVSYFFLGGGLLEPVSITYLVLFTSFFHFNLKTPPNQSV